MRNHRIQTRAVHGVRSEPLLGSVVTPIFQSSTYAYRGDLDGETVRYLRYSNTPSHDLLHRKLANLEGGEAAIATASGMAAISSALLSVLQAGDRLAVQDSLYGGTASFVDHDLPSLGIAVDKFDARRPDQLAEVVKPTTRAIYTEALSNPLVEVPDHEALIAVAKQHGLVTLIDSTFATPINYRPIAHGYDLVLHSCTKYMNGHNDLVAGAVIGSSERVGTVLDRLKHYGGVLDPHACFLLDRGLKTLALRVAYQNKSATRLAQFLEQHPAVAAVHYPGLESHPDHARGKKWFTGFGGVLTIDLEGGAAAAEKLMGEIQLATAAPSLGGVETLVSRPMCTSHAAMDPEERRDLGISDGMVRISVGVEDTDDLIADFEQALKEVASAVPVAV